MYTKPIVGIKCHICKRNVTKLVLKDGGVKYYCPSCENMPNILYFSAPWCSKCKITGPSVQASAAYYNLGLETIDCDNPKNEDLIKKYNIMSLPVIILLQHGKEVYRTEGIKTAEILINELSEHIC